MGSILVAAWIAQIAFWGLVLGGLISGDLSATRAAVFLILWLSALFGLPYLPNGAALFSPFVAALDIALVFIIFKGDVRLT